MELENKKPFCRIQCRPDLSSAGFSRILAPASKKGTFDNQTFYFEDFGDFSLDDVYHALDIICANNEALQKWIFDHSEYLYSRDLSVSYFDCTNYYFDIGRSDMDTLDENGTPIDKAGNPASAKYRKRGPEKITVLIPLLKWDYSWTAMVYLLHLTCFRETSQKKSI